MDVSSGGGGVDSGSSGATPAAPPSTSTPDTSTAGSTQTQTVERPTSFREAMARVGEATTPDPGATPPVVGDQPPDATVQAQPEVPPESAVTAPDAKGPIPFERHEAILKNARTKTEQEVTQRFQQQYGPHVQLGEAIQRDPVGTIVGLVNELNVHPRFGQAIISELARTLGSRRGQKAPTEFVDEPAPEADLVSEDGRIRAFSAEQLMKREAWQAKQLMQQIEQRLSPFQQREEQHQNSERYRAAMHDANTRMAKVLAPFKAMPEFVENQKAIAVKTKAFMDEGHDPQTALGLAVANILRDVVLPTKTAQSQKDMVAQAVAKSTGSTTVPGQAPAAPAKRPQSMAEGFAAIKW